MSASLVLDGVAKSYGTSTVVEQLHLALRPGEFLSLLGPSGCGKTTTLRMVAGFVEPSAGRVLVDGQVMSAPGPAGAAAPRSSVGRADDPVGRFHDRPALR